MKLRTALVGLLTVALVAALAVPAAAHGRGDGHHQQTPTLSPPGPVDISGHIGATRGQKDALRYVGDPGPRRYSRGYRHAGPYILTRPERSAVTFGTVDRHPTAVRDCPFGGFADYGFKNRRRCVLWVIANNRRRWSGPSDGEKHAGDKVALAPESKNGGKA